MSSECCDRHSRLNVPLKASRNGLSVGLPGRLKSSSTWFQYAQRSNAFEVNSVPLSTWNEVPDEGVEMVGLRVIV